ncbi:MAG TPA: outer membrane protein [Pseudolabrys sp.]|nr:outer membrane protein [Pseudolabrys sp.]
MRRFLSAAFAAFLTTTFAQIASAASPAAYTWTGFYLGVNAGYSWGHTTTDTSQGPATVGQYATGPCDNNGVGPATGCSFSTSSDPSGAIGGIQAGYDYQMGMMVYGIEADFDWRNQSDSSRTVFNNFFDNQLDDSNQKWVGTVRGRIGYAFANNFLAYVSGGLAYGNLEHTVTQTFCTGASNCRVPRIVSDSQTEVGWTVGGGVDYAIDQQWSFGVEYLYIDLESDTLSASAATVGPTLYPAVSAKFHDSSQILRARLDFRFN